MTEQKKHPNYEFIVAFAEGKQLQWRHNSSMWIDFGADADPGPWCTPDWRNIEWRIKPETRWYRVALFKAGDNELWTNTVSSAEDENHARASDTFVRWLTNRIEYTV